MKMAVFFNPVCRLFGLLCCLFVKLLLNQYFSYFNKNNISMINDFMCSEIFRLEYILVCHDVEKVEKL
jgi:hypothetical protein